MYDDTIAVIEKQLEEPEKLCHCFISWSYINGGSNTAHYEYCNELSRAGHKVTLIGRGTGEPYRENDNFLIYPIAPTLYGEKISHLAFTVTVLHHLIREKYDFINVFFCPGMSAFPLLLFWKRTHWVLHIRTSITETGLVKHAKNFLGWMEASAFDDITVIDKGMAKNLHFNERAIEQFLELPLGVSSRSFVRSPNARNRLLGERADGRSVLVYVGKMDHTRRLDVLIEAYRRVLASKPACLLLMVGDGNQRPALEKMVDDWDLNSSVLFTGNIPYHAVADYIGSADLALTYIPITQLYDNQPALKALEYLQMEVPQVATQTRANCKVIIDTVNGILTTDDAEGFALGILRLLNDTELRTSIEKQCRTGIERHYWQTIVKEKLIPFYAMLMSNNN